MSSHYTEYQALPRWVGVDLSIYRGITIIKSFIIVTYFLERKYKKHRQSASIGLYYPGFNKLVILVLMHKTKAQENLYTWRYNNYFVKYKIIKAL